MSLVTDTYFRILLPRAPNRDSKLNCCASNFAAMIKQRISRRRSLRTDDDRVLLNHRRAMSAAAIPTIRTYLYRTTHYSYGQTQLGY